MKKTCLAVSCCILVSLWRGGAPCRASTSVSVPGPWLRLDSVDSFDFALGGRSCQGLIFRGTTQKEIRSRQIALMVNDTWYTGRVTAGLNELAPTPVRIAMSEYLGGGCIRGATFWDNQPLQVAVFIWNHTDAEWEEYTEGAVLLYVNGPARVACSFHALEYEPGETFSAGDGCNTCTCVEGGEVVCTTLSCGEPTEPPRGDCVFFSERDLSGDTEVIYGRANGGTRWPSFNSPMTSVWVRQGYAAEIYKDSNFSPAFPILWLTGNELRCYDGMTENGVWYNFEHWGFNLSDSLSAVCHLLPE